MYARYKLNDGREIILFLYEDVLSEKNSRDSVTGSISKDGEYDFENEFTIELKKDESNKQYFEYDNQRIYFNNFEFMTVSELIEKIDSKEKITSDDVLATLLKDTESVGFIVKLQAYDNFLKGFGISMVDSSSDTKEVLCIPSKRHFDKEEWYYKIVLEPANIKERKKYAYEEYYFRDLISLIKSGSIKLVNRKVYDKMQRGKLNYSIQLISLDDNYNFERNTDYFDKDYNLPMDTIGFTIVANYYNPTINDWESNAVKQYFIHDALELKRERQNTDIEECYDYYFGESGKHYSELSDVEKSLVKSNFFNELSFDVTDEDIFVSNYEELNEAFHNAMLKYREKYKILRKRC